MLIIAGMTAITAAGLTIHLWLGLLLAGISLILLAVLRELAERQTNQP